MTTTPALQDSFKRMRSFSLGDSAEPGQKARYTEFFARLDTFARLDEPWTLVIKCVTGTCLEWKLSTSDNFHFGGVTAGPPAGGHVECNVPVVVAFLRALQSSAGRLHVAGPLLDIRAAFCMDPDRPVKRATNCKVQATVTCQQPSTAMRAGTRWPILSSRR